MVKLRLTRQVQIPDPLKVSRYLKVPELGPEILFFSGGTALNCISRRLKSYTHNSTHLVTPFDSGGSSAKLRKAFRMPSIGDLRSRLMALADESVTGHPGVYQLFNHRFPSDGEQSDLRKQLLDLTFGKGWLMAEIPDPMRTLICNQLGFFLDYMPEDFDLRGASIGNLILSGGYLNNHQHLDPILFLFSKLANVQGTVRAVVNDNLHLVAELEDGRQIIGQHLLTGKEAPPITSPIAKLFLSKRCDEYVPADCRVHETSQQLIAEACLICYPPGSFYSSLLANLLPQGVCAAIAANDCPKVYIPNLGNDPEQVGVGSDQLLQILLRQLRTEVGDSVPDNQLISFVMIDSKNGQYPGVFSSEIMEQTGIKVIDTTLVSQESAPYYDPDLLVPALLSLT